jgi:uncharacterized protein (UPF0332 family)
MEIGELIKKNYLERIKYDEKLLKKEIDESEYDLKRAKLALEDHDFKWAIIKSYYSMFHAAKAFLFSLGLREKRHFVVGIILEKLATEGKLEFKFVNDFKGAMLAREDADYRYAHTEETAEYLIDVAEEFLNKMKELLRKVR